MKEALVKKRYGIPALLLIGILLTTGIAVAAFTHIYAEKTTVKLPTSEKATVISVVEAGGPIQDQKELDLVLPASYNLKYTLTGDDGDYLKDESATISLDVGNDGSYTDSEDLSHTIALDESYTFSSVTSGQINQKIVINATARDNVLATVGYIDGSSDPQVKTTETTFVVTLEPTKA